MNENAAAPPKNFRSLYDRVCLVLALVGIASASFGAFISVAPNRLADGRPWTLWQIGPLDALIICALLAFFLASAFVRHEMGRSLGAFTAGAGLVLATLLIAGTAAKAHIAPDHSAWRVSLGSGFWGLFVVGLLASFHIVQRAQRRWPLIAASSALIAAVIAIVVSGHLDPLSLVREFRAQRGVFATELLRHIGLIAAALPLAILISIPLVLAAVYRRHSRATIFTSLSLLQTIPSIALFGLLIAPLSFVAANMPAARSFGIDGIGPAPAVIALTLYALLPLVRSADAGLKNVAPDVREAARGMGLTQREIFRQIDLPLALPALVSGLRIVTVQSIGLATVAALIGAGGLGTFVFQGIGQYALDLVLVGALPTIVLAVLTDALFQLVLARLRSRS